MRKEKNGSPLNKAAPFEAVISSRARYNHLAKPRNKTYLTAPFLPAGSRGCAESMPIKMLKYGLRKIANTMLQVPKSSRNDVVIIE